MNDRASKVACLPVLVLLALWAGLACGPSRAAETWEGADLTSLAAFVSALEGERYTALIFKRMSADLAKGEVSALTPLFERYYSERRRVGPEEPFDANALSQSVTADVETALHELEKSSALSVPDYMAEPVAELARRTALRAYGLGQAVPKTLIPVSVPEEVRNESLPEAKARAENTGLLRDAAEIFLLPHLRYLMGGDDQTSGVRVLAEILRVARNDNLIVDQQSVEAFVARLVEADKIHPDDWPVLVDQTLVELGIKLPPPPPADEAPPEADPPPAAQPEPGPEPEPEPEPEVQHAPEPDAKPEAVPDSKEPAPNDDASDAQADGAASATEAPSVRPPRKRTPTRKVAQRQPQRPAPGKSDLLAFVEAGAGASVPAADGKLAGVAGNIAFDPGPSAQFSVGVVWPHAMGDAHIGFSLVGFVGVHDADRLTGPGASALNGSDTYYGVMPYLTLELPVGQHVNLRLGGGIGIAERDIDAFSGGVKLVDVDGTSLAARVGAGVRFALAPCADAGFDVLATYLDGLDGSGAGGAPLRLRGMWDVAVHASIRVLIARDGAVNGCRLFDP